MKIVVGTDHAGFPLKQALIDEIERNGHEVVDVGTYNTDPVDYPDYAEAVGHAVQSGEADRGVLICGSGVGASVAANKMLGIRSAVCHDTYSAHQGVEHDDMNVLTLGARVIGPELAKKIVEVWLDSDFAGGNSTRKVEKINAVDKRYRQQRT